MQPVTKLSIMLDFSSSPWEMLPMPASTDISCNGLEQNGVTEYSTQSLNFSFSILLHVIWRRQLVAWHYQQVHKVVLTTFRCSIYKAITTLHVCN